MTVAEFKDFLEMNNIPDYTDIKVSGLDGIEMPVITLSVTKAQGCSTNNFDYQPEYLRGSITLRATGYRK